VLDPAQRAFISKHLPGFSEKQTTVTPAGSAASQRKFFRLRKDSEEQSYILMMWDSRDEDWNRFLSIPRELSGRIHFLPQLVAADPALGLILEEDLGKDTLRRIVENPACDRATRENAYRRALEALSKWQSIGPDASPAIASRSMDYPTFRWESDYFAQHCVVGLCGLGSLLDASWEAGVRNLANAAAALQQTFLHRDFQSENILLCRGEVRFVDFQGARLGPPAYDVASLLYDPYIPALDQETVLDLFDYYRSLPGHPSCTRHELSLCAAQRLMQALGAYGNLTINKGKPHYRRYVPIALQRLIKVLESLPEYGAIGKVAAACSEAIEARFADGMK
jgi:aminoglycoside/choline kinase family phosphotransferase